MAALGKAAARWAPGLWRRAVRAAVWLGGRRFASGGAQVRAADTGWAAGAREALRAGLGAGFTTSGCHLSPLWPQVATSRPLRPCHPGHCLPGSVLTAA